MSQVPISVEQHSTEAMASSEKEHWIDEPLDENCSRRTFIHPANQT